MYKGNMNNSFISTNQAKGLINRNTKKSLMLVIKPKQDEFVETKYVKPNNIKNNDLHNLLINYELFFAKLKWFLLTG